METVQRGYDTDLTDSAWKLIVSMLPEARPGGRPRTTDLRSVVNAILYLLRTGCQWRLLPLQFPAWGTVYSYFRSWEAAGVWVQLHRTVYEKVRMTAGREACPSVVIMDGQSVKTTERGGIRGFDGYKRVKGRKRHILVDTPGLMIVNRVEPTNMSDRRAGAHLLAGLAPLFPRIHTVIADAGHEPRGTPKTGHRGSLQNRPTITIIQDVDSDSRVDTLGRCEQCLERRKETTSYRVRALGLVDAKD